MNDDPRTTDFVDESEEIEQTWLTTFADLSLLLLVFFILLFSMSKIDVDSFSKSFASVRQALGEAKGGAIPVESPDAGVFQFELESFKQMLASQQRTFSDFNFYSTENGIEGIVGANLESGIITLRVPGEVLFVPGQADLSQESREIIGLLKEFFIMHPDQKINIRGYTDSTPPSPSSRFKDNWELSSMRAVNVLRTLLGQGMTPDRLTATGLADMHPLFPENSAENKAKNRRVEFILEKMVGGEAHGG
ncbi:MAG: flagellar motor protein MotB [Deltaproteobacteria bacterium]|nr:flagellar motor protein MotB [Deltaproteobacteria bacterium]